MRGTVCHCSGISPTSSFSVLKVNLLHNKPADQHNSCTGTCSSVPRDTAEVQAEEPGVSAGDWGSFKPRLGSEHLSKEAAPVAVAAGKNSQHFWGAVANLVSAPLCSCGGQNLRVAVVPRSSSLKQVAQLLLSPDFGRI